MAAPHRGSTCIFWPSSGSDSAGGGDRPSESSADDDSTNAANEDEEVDEATDFTRAIWDRVAAQRLELATSADDYERYFKVETVGGSARFEATGLHISAFQGRAVGQKAVRWCRRYGLQVSAEFDTILYQGGAKDMAQEYCKRLHWYYKMFLEDDSPDNFRYSTEQLESYREDRQFRDFANTLVQARALTRLAWLRRQVPYAEPRL
eukprot:gnl/TRDRNA2_/TRDRNA2_66672_c0_seq1.p1 gnl/TRDRNA2_/TRDRNA2_66672_c0~~gnl/TRDRNA2_/TRDRNA2_66672_c0_seq1.p1  ORF type:complete len:206 (-),score=30.40 gnl/TRDRNA2_/TRDRNA2_66672_c0_seq1:38-655(-)